MKTTVGKFKFIAKIARNVACLTAFFAFSASAAPVAKVGETEYETLEAAFAALSSEDYTLTLQDTAAWSAETPVHWAAGTQSGFATTLAAALTAGYKANEGAITIVCRPGADVGTMTHGHVEDNLTIYGNNAYLSGGECDLEVDTYRYSRATGALVSEGVFLTQDIVITAYELDNLGVWGQRHTSYTVTVTLTDCDGKALEGTENVQRVYISGTTGRNDITLTGCDFLTKNTAVYSNADGTITASDCTFTGGAAPFNINHKADGAVSVNVTNCSFKNCGDAGEWKQFAAPVRLVNSGAGTMVAAVTKCAFAETVGANGDILLGDGRTGQKSNDVTLKVAETTAGIQAQKPGYYDGETTNAAKGTTTTTTTADTLETSVETLLPVAATIGTVSYETLGAAIAAVKDGETVVVNAGEYKLTGSQSLYKGKAFTIKAAEDAKVSFDMSAAVALHGAKITFEGVTFDYKTNNNYTGLQHANTLVYNDCTINGKVFLYATSETFNRCVFNQSAVDYNVWTYGAQKVAFNDCTFNCAGKSVLIYNEGNGTTQKTDLTVTACKFKVSAGVTGKAAIEIDTSLMKGDTSVTIDDQTTATGFATGSNSGSTLWNDKKQTKATNKNVTVTVAGETVFAPAVAKIGEAGYSSLAEALAAAKDGETVTLLADVNGDGIVVPANAFPTGLVVDFAGHTYTVGGLLVGSSTTKSNGFQLLAGNKITFKNGSLVGATATAGEGTDWTGAPAILIQNYCDLTLEKMTVKGGDETCYTLSNNNGDIVIADSTIVAGKGTRQGPFAFDVCRYSSYPSVRVTVKGDSVIDGNVEVSGTIGEGQSRQLDIEGGTFKGTFSVANQPANIAISGGTFSSAVLPEYCAAGFIPTANGDGTFGVKEGAFVAEIGTAKYETLEAALAAAKDGETVRMLADAELTAAQTISQKLVLDLNGKTISSVVDKFLVITKGGDLMVNDATNEGRIENTAAASWARVLEMKGGVLTVNGGTIAANKATLSSSQTITVSVGSPSTINLAGGRIEAIRTASHAQGVIELGTYANATLNVTGGEIVGSGTGIRSLAGNVVNVSGGTIVGQTGNAVYSSKASALTITGGLFESKGASIAFGMGTGNSAVTIGREGGSATDVIIPSMDFDGRVVTVNLLSGTVKEFRKWTEITAVKVSQGAATLLVGTDISTKLPGSDLLCQKDEASGLYEVVKMTVENAPAIVLHDGVETPYNTIEQARQAVVDGDALTLKVDYTGALAFTAQNVTIDLGGKTLTGASNSHALSFNQSATANNSVTVKNGTIVAKGQDAACIRATSGDVAKTLTVVLGEGLTLTASSNNRIGRVVLYKGARTAAPCADVNNGGLLVTEDGKDWIYGETETAFTHANGTEVTLQNDWYNSDYDGTVKVPETDAFASAKLNLGGHTVKAYGGTAIVMGNDAKPAEGTAVKSLEISNGVFLTSSHGAAVCGSNKTLVFDNVELTTTGDGKLGLYVNGMTSGNAVTLKNGSALTAEKGTGIYFPGAGTLTVLDSAVTGAKSGIEIRAGVLNVSGTSAIASTATAFSFEKNDNGITTTGAAVAAVKHTVGNDLSVNISGGTFKGPCGFYANDPNPTTGGKVAVAISGGRFSTEPEAAYVADGCKVTRQTGEDGAALYVVGPAVTTIAVKLDGAARALPFPDAWLAANIGAAADGWTPEALAAPAANGLAKWQCYLFGLSTTDKAAAIVATAGQGTAAAIPLTVWNADASASPLVADGYVTVAYRLMGSDDGAAWTPVGDEATKADGLAIPLETKTYKFYRADVIVTPAE